MDNILTTEQKIYLQGLRSGDIEASGLKVDKPLSKDSKRDFENFKLFLQAYGHPNPEPNDLFLTVARQKLLSILLYADDLDRRCLILQNCFGFDSPPDRSTGELSNVGRVVMIQKGNFRDVGKTDEELFFGDSVFENGDSNIEPFLNMDIDQPLSVQQAEEFVQNFIDIYPADRTLTNNPFIHGFLLPVKALINLLTNQDGPFGQTDELTFRWGLTVFSKLDVSLGNFTLCIGLSDLRSDPVGGTMPEPVIEFRTVAIDVTLAPSDCPPRRGCTYIKEA